MEKNKVKICSSSVCVGCGACAAQCPKKCITMQENEEGFWYPTINDLDCINCGLCKRICPQNNEFEKTDSIFYMAWNKNPDVLMSSSSGGVFTAIAEWVLKQHGVVVGAVLNPLSKEVYHDIAYTKEGLEAFKLSKYYQSKTQHIFPLVKEVIKNQKIVLFTGTGCQVAAVKSYLGKLANSEYLITLDILCHGTANQRTVEAYIRDREEQYKKKIVNYKFRIKEGKEGWQSGSGTRMKLYFEDGSSCAQDKYLDTYFVGFNSNIFLRESCYSCKYCGQKRISDFTVADFWGVREEKVGKKQMYEGVSVVLINSKIANTILNLLKNNLYFVAINPMEAIPFNRAFVEPNTRPEGREKFFEYLNKYGFDKSVKKLNSKYYRNKRIKTILNKVLPKSLMQFIIKSRHS